MAEIVNLNRFRKDKARTERRAEADVNAAKHGRSRVQKAREADEAARARSALDARRLDVPAKASPPGDQQLGDEQSRNTPPGNGS